MLDRLFSDVDFDRVLEGARRADLASVPPSQRPGRTAPPASAAARAEKIDYTAPDRFGQLHRGRVTERGSAARPRQPRPGERQPPVAGPPADRLRRPRRAEALLPLNRAGRDGAVRVRHGRHAAAGLERQPRARPGARRARRPARARGPVQRRWPRHAWVRRGGPRPLRSAQRGPGARRVRGLPPHGARRRRLRRHPFARRTVARDHDVAGLLRGPARRARGRCGPRVALPGAAVLRRRVRPGRDPHSRRQAPVGRPGAGGPRVPGRRVAWRSATRCRMPRCSGRCATPSP